MPAERATPSSVSQTLRKDKIMTNLEWLKANNATVLDTVQGVTFYEDPRYGGDTGMWAEYKSEAVKTDYYDVPDADEMGDPEDFIDCYR